jgi:hypothetical protein
LALGTRVNLIRNAFIVDWSLTNIGGNLEERAVIARLKLAGGLNDEVYMDANVTLQIAFDQSSSSAFKQQESVIKVLSNIVNGVEQIFLTLESTL